MKKEIEMKNLYEELKKSSNLTKTKSIKIGEKEIKILQYLPSDKKINLIDIALQRSREGGGYSPLYLNIFLHLNILYCYTNIKFTEEDRVNELALFDYFNASGCFASILEKIPESELTEIYDMCNETKEEREQDRNTLGAIMTNWADKFNETAQQAIEMAHQLSPEDFNNAFSFAQSLNAGNPITPVMNKKKKK